MSAIPLEQRVADLEAEVAHLKAQMEGKSEKRRNWVNEIYGTFANDPIYEEAMRLGKEWRESFRPKPRKKRKKKE